MNKIIVAALLGSGVIAAAAPAQQRPAAISATHPNLPGYTARQFYETTTYGLAPASGAAFSRDGRSILISSDQTGVINTYALPHRWRGTDCAVRIHDQRDFGTELLSQR